MQRVYLGLGSNLGDRSAYLNRGCNIIEERIGVIGGKSSIYETQALGFASKSLFLNMVVAVDTALSAEEVLDIALEIENSCGRHRSQGGYADRTLDIDLLLVDGLILETERLLLPHPRMHERRFVLIPMAELAPLVIHPLKGISIKELLRQCNDEAEVKCWKEKGK